MVAMVKHLPLTDAEISTGINKDCCPKMMALYSSNIFLIQYNIRCPLNYKPVPKCFAGSRP